ncbi:MAG: DMT family transporter [Halofilum sp. (in: g-proteobacteria)]|nr:DMT family transporter [Halofilum sp. (in: g-proteobacteria)]
MENLRGSLLMVGAMLGFALEDMLVKQIAVALPIGQVIALIGGGGTLIFGTLARANGRRLLSPVLLTRPLLLRNLGEIVATACFVSAIVLTTLSSASAILQATPLAVTLGAALFLREPVGWRRWAAIGVGFAGVLLIIRPGLEGFAPASLLAVAAVAALALRDLANRAVPRDIAGSQIATWAFAAVIPTGLAMMWVMGTPAVMPGPPDVARLGGAFVTGGVAYYAIVAATRTGDVSAVVPFRYTRLLFALALGALVFGERPDMLMLAGAALIVGAGLYTIWRETALARQRPLPECAG